MFGIIVGLIDIFAIFLERSCDNLLLFGTKLILFKLEESIVSAKSVLWSEKFVFLDTSRLEVCSLVIRLGPFRIGFTFIGEDIAGSVLLSLFCLECCFTKSFLYSYFTIIVFGKIGSSPLEPSLSFWYV